MATGVIFDIMKYGIHDGPGIRTVVFFKGCPLSCQWCHNPESQALAPEVMLFPEKCIGCGKCAAGCLTGALEEFTANRQLKDKCVECGTCTEVCPSGARQLVGRRRASQEVLKEIDKDLIFYDESGGGVTFSGGEPLIQPGLLKELLLGCREREIPTAIETTGFANSDCVMELADLVDLWLYDLKLLDEQRHLQYTGVSNKQILENLKLLAQRGSRIIVRIPLIPGINDDAENIAASGEFIAALPGVQEVHILPYHRAGMDKYKRLLKEYLLADTEEPGVEQLETIADKLRAYGLRVKIGG